MVMNPMAVKKSPEKTNPIDMSWESLPHMVPVTHSAVHETLRIQICPKKGITPIHSYSFRMGLEPTILFDREGFGFLGNVPY